MMISSAEGLYAILTNPTMGYEKTTALCVEEGVRLVQLRMKDEAPLQVYTMARKLVRITAGSRTRLIINDMPRVAADAGADGVHIGQDDGSFEDARAIVGSECVVGISTHNEEEVRRACAQGPDYIAIGPVFSTATKEVPYPVLGGAGLAACAAHACAPVVAIGGITRETIHLVRKAGVYAAAVVGALNNAADPRELIRTLQTQLTKDIS
jgi:thiamine-phosphate pyrophosphorylase